MHSVTESELHYLGSMLLDGYLGQLREVFGI